MPMPIAGIMALKARAQQGDPQAQQELQMVMQEMQGGQPQGGPPQGGPPPGMVPPGQGQLSPQGGGPPVPADVAARRAQQLIQLLRARGDGSAAMPSPMMQQ